jgi:hypothetical protein
VQCRSCGGGGVVWHLKPSTELPSTASNQIENQEESKK